jgi:hypothetical protein
MGDCNCNKSTVQRLYDLESEWLDLGNGSYVRKASVSCVLEAQERTGVSKGSLLWFDTGQYVKSPHEARDVVNALTYRGVDKVA